MGDDLAVPLNVPIPQVVEQATPSPDHHQQTPSTVMIALMEAKMLGQVVDPFGQQGNLHLGRTCIAVVMTEFSHYLLGGLHERAKPACRGERNPL